MMCMADAHASPLAQRLQALGFYLRLDFALLCDSIGTQDIRMGQIRYSLLRVNSSQLLVCDGARFRGMTWVYIARVDSIGDFGQPQENNFLLSSLYFPKEIEKHRISSINLRSNERETLAPRSIPRLLPRLRPRISKADSGAEPLFK